MTYFDEILETNQNTKQMRNFKFYYWQEKNDECQDFEITIQATGAISWRAEGIRYKRNEVFIDIVENVNVLLSIRGTVLKADVVG